MYVELRKYLFRCSNNFEAKYGSYRQTIVRNFVIKISRLSLQNDRFYKNSNPEIKE